MRLDRLCDICDDVVDEGRLCPSCMNSICEAAYQGPTLDDIIGQALGETEPSEKENVCLRQDQE